MIMNSNVTNSNERSLAILRVVLIYIILLLCALIPVYYLLDLPGKFNQGLNIKQANEKQIAEMQRLQDELEAIQLKTHTLENQLVKEDSAKKQNASNDTFNAEINDIKKKNKELDKQEKQLYKLSPEKQAAQIGKIKEI